MQYRPDIDGLRAVAVTAAVMFHAFPGIVPGGFIGVDVFFVISGYLITAILVGELQAGTFSLGAFYARRIRRIFPALIIVLAACLLAGWFLLFADEFTALGEHVRAGSVFASNVVLWFESGYFDDGSHAKPLLHLWSLGIEEQFYLLWPLLLVTFWRTRFALCVALLLCASLAFAVAETYASPEAAFYLPMARGWELMAGALLVALKSRRDLSIPGALLILGAAFLFSQHDPYPGWRATVPVLGACLLLASPNGLVNGWLARPWPVFVGRISFPLYLWHWPLLAFLAIVQGRPAGALQAAVVVALSVALAWLTFRAVELPLRRLAAPALLCALLAVGLAGNVVMQANGLPDRVAHAPLAGGARPLFDGLRRCDLPLDECRISRAGPPTAAIIGDSHADHLLFGIAKADPRSWMLAAAYGSPPLTDVEVQAGARDVETARKTALVLDRISATPGIETVVISFAGMGYLQEKAYAAQDVASGYDPALLTLSSLRFKGDKRALFAQGLAATVERLERAGKRVVLVVDVPQLPFMPGTCQRRPYAERWLSSCELPRAEVLAHQAAMRSVIAGVARLRPSVRVFDPLGMFCDAEVCRFAKAGRLLYRDTNHLSIAGSEDFAAVFLPWLAAM